MQAAVERYWRELQTVVAAVPVTDVARAAGLIFECHLRGGKILAAGNGGSAATASHFATDLGKGTRARGVPPFRVLSLNDNQALLTAIGNDLGYERVFAEQVSALAAPEDVVLLISTSGNSPNVLEVARATRATEVTTIALTAAAGGRLARLVDHVVRVPTHSIEQAEDAHLIVCHSICVALRERLADLSRPDRPRSEVGSVARAMDRMLAGSVPHRTNGRRR